MDYGLCRRLRLMTKTNGLDIKACVNTIHMSQGQAPPIFPLKSTLWFASNPCGLCP